MTLTARQEMAAGGARPARWRKPCGVLAVLAAVSAVCVGIGAGASVTPTVAGAAAARVHWGKAEPVPGLAALNKGYNAAVDAIACWGAGGCVAGGSYTDRQGHVQAFVARERKGRWGEAIEVPGTGALNRGGNAQVTQVACARTSVCVAVGSYTNQGDGGEYFTATERNGRWRTAAQVPVPALGGVGINAAWCAPGGLCAAAGGFTDSGGAIQLWIETETHGRWQPALEVPGIAALNVGGYATVDAVTCASAGNCAAGGQYATTARPNPFLEPFVVTETNGSWGAAQEVPGIGPINSPELANGDTTAIACPSAGNCTAAGDYEAVSSAEYCANSPEGPPQGCAGAFVVNERHGTWGQVTAAPAFSYVFSLTCPATGDCVAAGAEANGDDDWTGALISETNDHWAGARLFANTTNNIASVSCASAGYCAAGGVTGTNSNQSNANNPFLISEWRGTWGKVVRPRGVPTGYNGSEPGGAAVNAVACPPKIALCIAGGYESPRNSNRAQAFTVSQNG
jgi:hypothetical protein